MTVAELVALALARLASNRVRAGLTILGVTIGVASVIALVAVSEGATSGVTDRLRGLGTNLLTVNPATARPGVPPAASTVALTVDDADAIRSLDGVAAVAPERSIRTVVSADGASSSTIVIGSSADYALVRNFAVWQGSFFGPVAVDRALRSAVLGAAAADALGLGEDAVGRTVSIRGLPFTVVGILQPKGAIGPWNPDDEVVIPITTMQQRLSAGDAVRPIGVSVGDPAKMGAVAGAIEALLEQRHHVQPGDPPFSIVNQGQILSTTAAIATLLTILLAGIASISLVVGGIGIMNIMLVSVRERTREIGIRKAVGARGSDILAQFLVEALTVSVLGGAAGAVLGVVVAAAIGAVAGWGLVLDPLALVAAVAFAVAVGVGFGVWPARRAALLDPVAALRYE